MVERKETQVHVTDRNMMGNAVQCPFATIMTSEKTQVVVFGDIKNGSIKALMGNFSHQTPEIFATQLRSQS